MFHDELDLLEIRLSILDPCVDFFVLGESLETFSGKEKPLYYLENKERFAKWEYKIIHAIIPKTPTYYDSFERAGFQKDFLRRGITQAKPEDIIYYSDCDEIWTPQTEEGKLRQLAYSYFLNNRSSEDWQGTNMCYYKNIRNLNELRADHSKVLENGGWHFTNLMSADGIRKKLESYDHQEMNTEEIKSKIKQRIENGEDYLGRKYDWKGNEFKMWVDESELPDYLKENREKWKHLFKSQ